MIPPARRDKLEGVDLGLAASQRPAGGVAAIVLAGGTSSRMGIDKLWVDLGGRPVLAWSLQAFAATEEVDRLVVVASAGSHGRVRALAGTLGVEADIVEGGERRRDSVLAGLRAAASWAWVVVHDGARPFVTVPLIRAGLAAAGPTGAAIAAVPVTDTMKRVEHGTIVQTVDRHGLWAAQTPQVFRRAFLLEAHERVAGDVTDDAAMLESIGVPVRVYPGAYGNIKVTYPEDLALARVLAGQHAPVE